MLKLIQNEWIKIFTKISTWIMLALVALFAVGLTVISKSSMTSYSSSGYTFDDQYYASEIDYLNMARPQGYELQVKQMEYMRDSQITWTSDSWQYTALCLAFEQWQSQIIYGGESIDETEKARLEEQFNDVMAPVLADDWESYAQKMLANIQSSEESDSIKAAQAYPYEYMLERGLTPETCSSWQFEGVQNLSSAMERLALLKEQQAFGGYVSDETMAQAEDDAALYQYIMDHEIESYIDKDGMTASDYWESFLQGASVVTIASVVMVVLAGGSVANEFSSGTIKFLLINPVRRGKIIISKYITLVLVALAVIAGVFIISGISNIFVFGADFDVPYLTVSLGIVHEGSSIIYTFTQYLLSGINLLAMMTMAFMISSLMRNAAVAIGIGVAALMGGSMIVVMLAQLGCDWGRYIIFANMNLTQIAQGNSYFPNQTLTFSIITLAAYMVVFLLTAYDGFTRREV